MLASAKTLFPMKFPHWHFELTFEHRAACGLAVLVALAAAPAYGQSVEVTQCGTLFGNERRHLAADLACTGSSSAAVAMDGHSELDLAGHTLSSDGDGIACLGHCTIVSSAPGGSIVGTGASPVAAIDARYGASVRTEGVLLSGFKSGIVDCREATLIDTVLENMSQRGMDRVWDVRLVRSSVRNNVGTAMYYTHKLNATDSDISNNTGHGLISPSGRISLTRSSIVDNSGHGIGCDFNCDLYPFNGIKRVKAEDSEISRNGWVGIDMDVRTGRIKLMRTTIADNGQGGATLLGGVVKARESQITGNGGAGVAVINNEPEQRCKISLLDSVVASNAFDGLRCESASRARISLRRSSATANGTDAACGVSESCSDLDASEEPRLSSGATCDTSHVSASGLPGQSWGVCSLD